jgi:hypothetical protein
VEGSWRGLPPHLRRAERIARDQALEVRDLAIQARRLL